VSKAQHFATLLRAVLSPQIIVRHMIRALSFGTAEFRLAMQALDKAQYAFGIKQAIYLASRLNHSKVSVLEFGVGAGNGLKRMEEYAASFSASSGIGVDVYGFDLGLGLPTPADQRDVPYVWRKGDYEMNPEKLRSELQGAKLLIGDVQETVPEFIRSAPAPIGFIGFDLDYYSSTIAAFQIFGSAENVLLPRIICYFDDVGSDGRQLHCDNSGELLAIDHFNRECPARHQLYHTLITSPAVKYPAPWMHQMWVYHRFTHGAYNTYIEP
jgi:hypothetical protein